MTEPDEAAATERADSRAFLPLVLSKWRRQLRGTPEAPARSGERGDCEYVLVANLLRVTDSDDEANLAALAAVAARYGASDRRQRIDPGALCEEFSALRMIVWELLEDQYEGTGEQSVTRILRFDRALSIVIRAALRAGYDPDEIKKSLRCAELPNE